MSGLCLLYTSVVDPMGEYSPLIKRLGGQVIEIAPDSPHHILSLIHILREQGEKVQTEPEKKAPSGRDAER